jgi:hypothetical protein
VGVGSGLAEVYWKMLYETSTADKGMAMPRQGHGHASTRAWPWQDDLSVGMKMISFRLQVFVTPKADNRYFLCEGKLWRTSKEDITQGVYSKYSTME